MKRWPILLLASFLLAASASGVDAAGGAPAPAAGGPLSLDQAVHLVEQRYHARVVKAESQKDNGRTTYVLRLLNESGKVWTVHVDAASGSVQ